MGGLCPVEMTKEPEELIRWKVVKRGGTML